MAARYANGGTIAALQEGVSQAVRREAHDAQLHQPDTSATENCQQELAQSGAAEFILDYAWEEDTVEDAMTECTDLTLDDLLAPDDSGDDESDDDF